VGDDGLLVAGGSSRIQFLTADGTKPVWQDSFDKHNDLVSDHVETSASGEILAIAVKSFSGGNKFLDISPRLRHERIVVYKSTNGSRIKEIRVSPDAASVFGFALSADGKTVATVADGYLEIVPINYGHEGDDSKGTKGADGAFSGSPAFGFLRSSAFPIRFLFLCLRFILTSR
jgi:hypothetical protein